MSRSGKSVFLTDMQSHLSRLIDAGDTQDAIACKAMWPAVLDTRTGRFPPGEHVPRRVYRLIGAPRGSTLYWDQPLIVAAFALSALSGDSRYAEAADAYVDAFLARCVDEHGMFCWGNHQYYDLFEDRIVAFQNGHHELRPITPAWEIFWRHDAGRTARYIRTMADRHVYDRSTGAFNRHDIGRRGHAFIEAGGILVESLAWLYRQTDEHDLLDLALRVARYSYAHRGASTGLVANEPDQGRWDSHVCTTEVGLWAQSLLRAAAHASSDEPADMAADAVRAYLRYGYDEASARYLGQVRVDDGMPVTPTEAGYWPRRHADPWSTDQWPTHDYPMALAEACLTLHARTGDNVFLEAIRRWARIAVETRPERTGRWAYAESYGRCIHFLARAAGQLNDGQLRKDASSLADEAVDRLVEHGVFQGYPDGHVYESVDGVGFLLLALILVETGTDADLRGFGF